MDDVTHTDAVVFLLPEENFEALQEIRNQMYLIAMTIFVATREEEKIPLQLPRSMLARCFQIFASQITDALDDLQQLETRPPRTH
jgi:hypothetical protein